MWIEEHIFQATRSYTSDGAAHAPERLLVQFWLVNMPLLSMQLPLPASTSLASLHHGFATRKRFSTTYC